MKLRCYALIIQETLRGSSVLESAGRINGTLSTHCRNNSFILLEGLFTMAKFTDSLRGYALEVHKRDHFKCLYCGVDGTKSFETWLTLSWDHLLPKGHADRDNPEYIW